MVRTLAEVAAEPGARAAGSGSPRPRRVAIVADFLEEGWPSMDLAAELTAMAIDRHGGGEFRAAILRPKLPRVARRLPGSGARAAFNADRYLGRYLSYPRWLAVRAGSFDLFHVIDHSYSHLVHVLPADRAVVTCHDLDAFRSLADDERESRPWWFRATMRRVLTGMTRAARVICDSESVRDRLDGEGVVNVGRLCVVPLPVHPDFSAERDDEADRRASTLLRSGEDMIDLLHVGSTAPRKRIGFLLELFAELRKRDPRLRLVRVGGPLPGEERARARRLGVDGAILELPFVDRKTLAAVYRRCAALLVPSEREGFGWPVLEGMACGAPVVASDIEPHREVGSDVVTYVPVHDLDGWTAAVESILRHGSDPVLRGRRRSAAVERARAFSLEAYARGVLAAYRRVLGSQR